MKSLIIVDVQNDFLPGGALPVTHGEEVIPVINALQECFTCVIATKDWHPKGHTSFASTYQKKYYETLVIEGKEHMLWPDHCLQGSFGAEFAPGLDVAHIRKVFYKGADPLVDSYSAFYDNGHVQSTGLGEYLLSNKIDELYIVGLATDYCVKYSVLDARRLGFKVTVIKDGCRGIDPKGVEEAFKEMEEVGAEMITSSALLFA